jgi:hypothetical protein
MSAQNFFLLSNCKIIGEELIEKNKSNKKVITSTAHLKVRGFAQKNLVK